MDAQGKTPSQVAAKLKHKENLKRESSKESSESSESSKKVKIWKKKKGKLMEKH